jgi:hypothetical protein
LVSAKDILLQILNEASAKSISLGKTHLVKILYLTEVEYYRQQMERLTSLRWLFYHFGPYAIELETILADREFEKTEIKTQTDKDFILFKVNESKSEYKPKVDSKLSLLIKKIVGQWGNKSLEELLDYVYFETEPMESVKQRGDVLDFDTIKPQAESPKIIPLKASREAEKKVAELRARIAPFFASMSNRGEDDQPRSEDYYQALEAWSEEENPELKIPPGMIVTIKPPFDSSEK